MCCILLLTVTYTDSKIICCVFFFFPALICKTFFLYFVSFSVPSIHEIFISLQYNVLIFCVLIFRPYTEAPLFWFLVVDVFVGCMCVCVCVALFFVFWCSGIHDERPPFFKTTFSWTIPFLFPCRYPPGQRGPLF